MSTTTTLGTRCPWVCCFEILMLLKEGEESEGGQETLYLLSSNCDKLFWLSLNPSFWLIV